MTKVAFFLDSPFLSGAEAQALRNIRMLSGLGIDLEVFSLSNGRFLEELREELSKIPQTPKMHLRTPAKWPRGKFFKVTDDFFNFLNATLWAFQVLRHQHFDVWHVNNGGYPGSASTRGFLLGLAIRQGRTKVVASVNNSAIPYTAAPTRFLDWPADFMLSKMNIIWVTGSHDSSERLKRVLNLLPSRLLVIPNGCPAPSCKCGLGTRTSEESENSNRVVALSVGHLERRKGHAVLVEALALLKNSGSLGREWLFRIEGEGAEYLSLQRRIKNEGLEGVVQLIGKAFCVYHEFLNSDVLIHPSISNEDLPNVISEAMAMKIPAIGTRVAGIPEQIDDGKTGFLVMPGSTVELAHAVKTIMSDPVLRLNMSSQARERYLQLFSPVQAEARYLELYGVEGVKPH